eukprot:Rhum_TRINITY_DN1481_c0_g1::Rhum_TRINITY_DN1481_c0_g1_i1::g.4311::m.4311
MVVFFFSFSFSSVTNIPHTPTGNREGGGDAQGLLPAARRLSVTPVARVCGDAVPSRVGLRRDGGRGRNVVLLRLADDGGGGPYPDHAVLRAGGEGLRVGRVLQVEHRSVVSLVGFVLRARRDVVLLRLQLRADGEVLEVRGEIGAVGLLRRLELLDDGQVVGVEKADGLGGGDHKEVALDGPGVLQRVQTLHLQRQDNLARPRVPLLDDVVRGAREERVAVVAPQHRHLLLVVVALPDLGVGVEVLGVEDADLLVHRRGHDLRLLLVPVDELHAVGVRPRVEVGSAHGVPQLDRVVTRRRCDLRGLVVEARAEDGALVPVERAHPVPGLTIPQHRLAIVAAADEPVRAVDHPRVCDVGNRPRVAGAHLHLRIRGDGLLLGNVSHRVVRVCYYVYTSMKYRYCSFY